MRILVVPIILIPVFLGTVLLAQDRSFHNAPDSARALKNPYEGTPEAVQVGKRLYGRNCLSCHGKTGRGTGNVPSLVDAKLQSVTDGELLWFITKGSKENGMPSWAFLPKAQRWEIVAYVKSLESSPAGTEASEAPAAEAPASRLKAPPPPAPFTDFRYEKPGTTRKITANDLPEPFVTKSADNGPDPVARPANAWPVAPGGMTSDGKPETMQIFATGLRRPYGIAFYPPGPDPQWIYIGNTNEVVRLRYHNGDLKASGPPEHIAELPTGGHWTRSVEFSPDGKRMFVAVGSESNDDDTDTSPGEKNRADILVCNPESCELQVFAYGIRNAGAGIAIDPQTGELWCSANERDALGDNLVPDYITHVQEGGFYGWPWWYIGGHQDPRQKGKHPELKDKVIVPDVLLQPHNASMQLTFYQGSQFPAEYRGDIFASQHGSWNRAVRTGYEVIRVPLHQTGKATGEYQDFLTGFVLPDGHVWGRPVGITVASDGSMLVSDDASNSIWRVSHSGK